MDGDSQSVILGLERVPVPCLLAFLSLLCTCPSACVMSATSGVDIIDGIGWENLWLDMSEKLIPGHCSWQSVASKAPAP